MAKRIKKKPLQRKCSKTSYDSGEIIRLKFYRNEYKKFKFFLKKNEKEF